jgi:hypothetical protein
MSQQELTNLFTQKAKEPPPEASRILAAHLQSKESCELARAVSDAMSRHVATGTLLLPTPGDLLPPLG